MATINLIQIYINVYTKQLVSVNGSPTTIPPLFYGDTPTFAIYPVTPISNNPLQNGGQNYNAFSLAGYTMNLTMADTPNAANPPTPFAFDDGMTWNAALNAFTGSVNLTLSAVGTFLQSAASKTAYFNIDVFDASLNRTTLIQTTFSINASIDTVTPTPSPGGNQNLLTVAQAQSLFVQIGAIPGKFIEWEDDTSGQKYLETVQNGVKTLTPIS